MAKFFGQNWANAVAVPTGIPVPSGDAGGSERAFYDQYTVPASAGPQINDTIDFCQPSGSLKTGDRVVACELVTDAASAGLLLSLGDDANPTRFITATSAAAAGRITLNNYANYGYQIDQDRPIRATITGAAPAAALNIKMKLIVLRS